MIELVKEGHLIKAEVHNAHIYAIQIKDVSFELDFIVFY